MAIIDGKQISLDIKDEVREEVKALNEQGIYPGLAVVLVGENPASQVYVRNKKELVSTQELSHLAMNFQILLQKKSF